jgi:hypothetical protein
VAVTALERQTRPRLKCGLLTSRPVAAHNTLAHADRLEERRPHRFEAFRSVAYVPAILGSVRLAAALVVASGVGVAQLARGQTFQVLYNFAAA